MSKDEDGDTEANLNVFTTHFHTLYVHTVTCPALPLTRNCDSVLGDEAMVRSAPLDFSIVDPDGLENTVLEYSILSGNSGAFFSIDRTTGDVFLARPLDRDLGPSQFTLEILVSDGMFNTTLQLDITVEDVNDNPPVPVRPVFSGSVAEEQPRFTPVLRVNFTDADIGPISYFLDPSETDFAILDPSYGAIVTNRAFNYEAGDRFFSFQVSASDGVFVSNATVEITVLDENDNRPSVVAVLLPGAEYIENEAAPNVTFATITVTDVDNSDTFPTLFAVITITNGGNVGERVTLPAPPPGFRVTFLPATYQLVVVGAASPSEFGSLLSSIVYSNPSDEFALPLNRTIQYSVCDQLLNDTVPSALSPDTQAALTSTNASDGSLPASDVPTLISSCSLFASASVVLPLVEVNDRPTLASRDVELPSIPEDLPVDENRGVFVLDAFGDVVVDSDRGGFMGVAVVGFNSSIATLQNSVTSNVDFCTNLHSTLRSTCSDLNNRCSCDGPRESLTCMTFQNRVYFQCTTRLSSTVTIVSCTCQSSGLTVSNDVSLENILRAEIDTGFGRLIDVTAAFTNTPSSAAFELNNTQEYSSIAFGNANFIFTYTDLNISVVPYPALNITYTDISAVSEVSATLLGPFTLIRFLPFPNEAGTVAFLFRAWDGTFGAVAETRVDTTNPLISAFSIEVGTATIDVTPVNDPPEIQLGGPGVYNFTTTYTENGSPVFVSARDAEVIEYDPTDLTLNNLRVNITNENGGCDLPDYTGNSQDRLEYLNDTMVPLDGVTIATEGQACVSYIFEGRLSVNQWRSFLTMIRFRVEDAEPSDHQRRLAFVISDDAPSDSSPSYTFISVTLVSDNCPVLNLTSNSPLTYLEHSGRLRLDGGLTVSDEDRNAVLQAAEVRLIPNTPGTCTSCNLNISSSDPAITITFNSATLTLRLDGPAPPNAFETLLRSVQFEDLGSEPSFTIVTVRFTLIDGGIALCPNAVGDINVVIEHLNDNSPELFLDFPVSEDFATTFTEGVATVAVTGSTMIVDQDGQESSSYRIRVEIVSGCVSAEDLLEFVPPFPASSVLQTYNSSTCSLEIEGSRSNLENDLTMGLRYRNLLTNNPTPGQRGINFTIFDGTLPPRTSQTTLTVVAVNDPPFIDLDIANLASSDSSVIFRVGTTGSIPITGSAGGSITDPDSTNLVEMLLILTEIDAGGNPVSPRSDIVESIALRNSTLLASLGLSGGAFVVANSELRISGVASVASYAAVLNDIVYANARIPPTENRREISVTVFDDNSTSLPAVARISFMGRVTPPILDLNGNAGGTSVQADYTLTTPPLPLFPSASLSDPDSNNICNVNLTLIGSDTTCFPTSINFRNAFADVVIDTTSAGGRVLYTLTTTFTACREAIVFQQVLRGVTFSSPDTASPGTCTITVVAVDTTGLSSNINVATVTVRQFNAPPFIDLDLGLSGRDYSTVYFQGGRVQNIVSIFDAARAHNITTMTPIGEADGEAPFDDGTVLRGVVLSEQSYAGYTLTDVDSPNLVYLQTEFVISTTIEQDVIRYPCVPTNDTLRSTLDPRGCISPGQSSVITGFRCDDSLFDSCRSPDDLCSDLRVTIFCAGTGRKGYRFEYLVNASTARYEALLGYLGYQYLLLRGGLINQIRLINITAFDGESVNPQAITRIRIQNQDVLVFIIDSPAPNVTFTVREDERPGRNYALYTVTVMRLDGTTPTPGTVEFTITSGNIGNAFRINNRGEIFLVNQLDRETIAQYNLTISAKIMGADNDTTSTGEIIVGVLDVNDNHPITAESYTVNVTEGVAGARVVDVVATDADEGTNAELTYLLLGIGAEKFQVDTNGVVTTRVALNVSLEDYYLLVMIITDRGQIYLSTHTIINVYVITPPPTNLTFDLSLSTDDISINEGTPVNTMVGMVVAFEAGGDRDTTFIRYRILDIEPMEVNPPFRVNSETGEIFVNAPLDSERSTRYQVLTQAYSTRTLFPPSPATLDVIITIQDVNELRPMFVDSPYNISVAENTVSGTTVYRLVATDNDAMNQGLVYSLHSPVPADLPFQVEADGDIIVSGPIDYELNQTFAFTVQAADNPAHAMPQMTGTAQVFVTVQDRNDNPPVFQGTPYNVSVRETSPNGHVVLTFSVTDADSDANSNVSFSARGITGTPFCLSGMTIQVCNSTLLTSIEMEEVFQLQLVATNFPGPQEAVVNVTITLVLINEFAPALAVEVVNHSGYHEEHCGRGFGRNCSGIVVFNFGLGTTDEDGGPNRDLFYILATPGVPFEIDRFTGVLSITGRIDREQTSRYSLEIIVVDSADIDGTVRNDTAIINVPIYDIDDNPPVFVPPFSFSVTEQMTTTTQVFGNVIVTDPDINGTRSYYILIPEDPPLSQGCYVSVGRTHPSYLPIQIITNTGALYFCTSVDFETENTFYTFTVRVLDNGLRGVGDPVEYAVDQVYNVTVVDSNDHPPSLGQPEYGFTHPENEPASASVGNITATDEDSGLNGELTFSISFNGSSLCSEDLPFQIEKISETTATLMTCLSLDYEMRPYYTFTVEVCDSAPVAMCISAPVRVNVTDRNDNPPLFPAAPYTAAIPETDSSLLALFVVKLEVVDEDSPPNSISLFTILTSGTPFGIRNSTPTTAEVFVQSPLLVDYEAGPREFVVEVQATNAPADPRDETQSANTTVTITVTDENDNAPQIFAPLQFEVRENVPVGTAIGCVNATDVDSGENAELQYYIGDPASPIPCSFGVPFQINITTGCIASCQMLDYELSPFYAFTVTVCDRGSPELCSNATIRVDIVDLNDNAPVYAEDPFVVDVNENTPVGETVLVVTSSDADSPLNSAIVYEFVNTSAPFALRNGSNEVYYTGTEQLDYEGSTRTYILHLRGTNPPRFAYDETFIVDVAITINVVDRNDRPPVFDPNATNVSINEHSPIGLVVYTLDTSDMDTLPNSGVRYVILEPGLPFAINESNIVVSDSSAIDYDPPNSVLNYVLTIQAVNEPAAIDDETQYANFSLTINVLDINDNAPECLGPSTFMLPEDSEVSFQLRRIMATDIDSGLNGQDGLVFSREMGSGSGDPLCSFDLPFRIDPDSGFISICTSLDYERIRFYDLNITICDSGLPQMCSECPLTIFIMDVNDNAPVINPPTRFSVNETAVVGDVVGCINATDEDSGQNAVLSYTVIGDQCTMGSGSGSGGIPFALNVSSGCIEVCIPLDFERIRQYTFDVNVTDSGSVVLSAVASITITVVNENDHAPVITSPNIAYVVEEQADAFVINVTAIDIDAHPHNSFTFELVDDAGGRFRIGPTTGTVETTVALDRENQSSYTIVVQVSDATLSSSQTLTIFLVDINDNDPVYLGNTSFIFMEEMLFEVVLLFEDADNGTNALLSFTVSDSRFAINSDGVLRNRVPLDRDPLTSGSPSVLVMVTATDGGEPQRNLTVSIVIVLLDINDNAPIALPPYTAEIVDGAVVGDVVLTVSAVDADTGDNGAIVFAIGDDSNVFLINETTGVITLNQDVFLTSSSVESVTLVVNISDRGIPLQVSQQVYTFFIVSSIPLFSERLYVFSVPENSLNFAITPPLRAMDRDNDASNDDFVYSLLTVTPYDTGFRIVSEGDRGTLYTPRDYFDFEDSAQFELAIGVSRANMTDIIDNTTIVRVEVVDLNDNPPRLSPPNIVAVLPENAANGTIVGTAVGIDFDTGVNGQLTYNHSGEGASYFRFDADGNFIVANSDLIDFETDMNFTFSYEACDGGSPRHCSEPGSINITIGNVDDLPPRFDPSVYTRAIAEDFPLNTVILYVSYSDPDTPQEGVTLSLSPPQTLFQIAQVSGALMTTNISLDHEVSNFHAFSIIATDTAGATSMAQVFIQILDVNDVRPRVEPAESRNTFMEQGAGAFIAQSLTIVDEDDVSLFPLTSVSISLHPSPSAVELYPLSGGFCDHANYSILYDNNVFDLCGIRGCRYLVAEDDITISGSGTLQNGILDLPARSSLARSSVLLSGSEFLSFTASIWVRLTTRGAAGSIFQVASGLNILLGVQANSDGSLSVFRTPSPTVTETLLLTGTLNIHDGEWHQVALVRDNDTLTLYFDSAEVSRGDTADQLDTSFTSGSFFIGDRLASGFYAELYFCSSTLNQDDIRCTLTCGESFEVSSTPNVSASIDLRTRSVELEYTGNDPNASLSSLQDALRTVVYVNTLDEPHPLDRGVFISISDIVGSSDVNMVVTVSPILINDQPPVLDLNGLTNNGIDFQTTFSELSTGTQLIGREAILYDRDSGFSTIRRIVVEIVGAQRLAEALTVSGPVPDITLTLSQDNTRVEILSNDSAVERFPGQFLDALRAVQYVDLQQEPGVRDRIVRFVTVEDAGGLHSASPQAQTTVTVVPTNDPPELDLNSAGPGLGASVLYPEQLGRVRLIQGTAQRITDPDSTTLTMATFTITARPDGAAESLRVDETAFSVSVTWNFNTATGILTIQGTYSFIDWLSILRAVEYMNTNRNPDVSQARTVSVRIQDDGGAWSDAAATVSITIQQYNDPPELYVGGPGVRNFQTQFIEDGNCVPITSPDIQLVDVDSDRIGNVQMQLSGSNVNPALENITILGDLPVNTFFIRSLQILYMVLEASSAANYEAGLSRVVYCNSADEPAVGNRRVTFFATDEGVPGTGLSTATSTTVETTIEIVRVNDQPVLEIEPLNNVSIRGVPTPIIDPDSITLEDSDDMFFDELFIYITNDQDGRVNEIIEFARQLPEETTSIGPLLTDNGEILYNVTFRGVGANRDRVLETIAAIRYNNRATNITVNPPRMVCIQVRDFKIFSPRVCVNVTISPPNDFDPRFLNNSASLVLSFDETPTLVSIVRLAAVDEDAGLAGEISYDIVEVRSTPFGSSARVTTPQGLFVINSVTGQLDATLGLDAEQFVSHTVTVEASDMGNPSRSATVQVQISVQDLNDEAPRFIGTPYVAPSQREEQTPPRNIFTVRASDADITPANNRIARYSLLNFNTLFSINPTSGQIQSVALLDADVQAEYLLNVSAEDTGSPPQITYVIVSFTLVDFNDNAGQVDQLTPAVYVVQDSAVPHSIGPAMRIVDQDLSPPSISQLRIILTPNPSDSSRTYDQCLGRCQDVRIADAGLTPGAVDLLRLATFQSDNNVPGAFMSTTLGNGSCPAISLVRGTTIQDDGYGRINRSDLPANFGEGDFSFSFVATMRREGYIFVVPNTSNPNASPSSVERELGLWIRRRRIDFYYVYGSARIRHSVSYTLQSTDPIEGGVFFTWPTGPFTTRHFTLVVRSTASPPVAELYVDCQLLAMFTLNGAVQRPNSAIDVFIGHSVPHPTVGGRLQANLTGFYYHPTALTPTQLLNICSCGFEALRLPTLPPTIQATRETNHEIVLAPTGSLIPEADALRVLRGITYQNTFFPPTFEPDRQLEFRVVEVDLTGTSFGSIKLVSSDNELPVIDLNGVGTISQAGINFQTEFTEDAGPVIIVSPSVRLDRLIQDSVIPTFDRITVELLNPVDVSETLSARSTSSYIRVNISSDGHRVDIVGPAIPADFIPVILTLSYDNTNDRPTTSFARNISFLVVDTEGRTNSPLAYTSVSLVAVNDAPVVSLASINGDLMDTVAFVEGSSNVSVAPDTVVHDVDNDNLAGATVTLLSPNLATDTLTFTTQPGITGSYNPLTGNLTFTGTASLTRYQETLRSVGFQSTDSPFLDNSGAPVSDPNRNIHIFVTDGFLVSRSAQVLVQFSPIDNPPEIDLGITTLFFADGDSPLLIAPNANITDADNRRLASMNVELSIGVDDNVLSDGLRASRVLVFGENLLTNYVSILRNITYINTAAEPTLLNRTVSVSVCDFREDRAACPVATLTIVVQDRNDNPPVFDNPEYTLDVVENSAVGTTLQSLHVSDIDRIQPISFIFTIVSTQPVPFTLEATSSGDTVNLVTSGILDFESLPMYNFTVRASDGLNVGTTEVSVLVTNVNEPPSIVLNPPDPAIVASQVMATPLVQVAVNISDPDADDIVVRAQFTITNIPAGSNETLNWNPIPGYIFTQTSLNVFSLENNASTLPISEALASILYVAGQPVTQPAEIRTVGIIVFDEENAESNRVNISVSLASRPMFITNTSEGVYSVSLPEGIVVTNFLQVSATVESGGPVITYAIEPGVGVTIDPISGLLSLDRTLDREVEASLDFEVYAVDDLPPARTGTATVRITVLDQNDIAAEISGLNNITIFTNVPSNPFSTVTITDPDSVGFIEHATITIVEEAPLVTSQFTGQTCVDESNTITKMATVCGLQSFIDLLAYNGSSSGATLTEDAFNNRVLYNRHQSGYTHVDADFSAFEGRISAFTFALWLQPQQSGYLAYYGAPDASERYFALFFDAAANQLIATMKQAGLSGLQAQVRVSFQLSASLTDGRYHFVMLQYSSRALVCVVDGVRVPSLAVVYKEQSFIGEVFGESC